jgi:hypothetical protein
MQMQGFPTWPLQAQLVVSLAQGDIDEWVANMQRQLKGVEDLSESERQDGANLAPFAGE